MRRLCSWTSGLLLFAATFTAQAGLIALWTFDAGSTAVNQNPVTGSSNPNYQNTASLSIAAGVTFTPSGTVNGDPRTSPLAGNGTGAGGGTLTLEISGSGLSGFKLDYQAYDAGSGSQSWTWSANGGASWNSVSTSLPINISSYSPNTVDFSAASGSTIEFRNTIAGSVGFDNFQVTAVPEPINYALAGFGLCVGGISVGRRFVRKVTRT